MQLTDGLVLENTQLADRYYLLRVDIMDIQHIKPGQFFMLQAPGRFLRRPVSVHNAKDGVVEFYYEVKGKGTQALAKVKAGESLSLQGSLGNGFTTELRGKNLLIIGGGMGIAPMNLLLQTLREHNRVTLVAGFATKNAACILSRFNLEGLDTHFVTDDGSFGKQGNVVQCLENLLDGKSKAIFDQLYVCGPSGMMQKILERATAQGLLSVEFSLESHFGCGVGACMGCSTKTKEGSQKICSSGPVFKESVLLGL